MIDLDPAPSEVVASSVWSRASRLLRPLAWIVVIPVALLFAVPLLIVAVITKVFDRPLDRTPEEVAEILEARIAPDGGTRDWIDFVSSEIADPGLDAIRRECLELDRHHPALEPTRLDAEAIARIECIIVTLHSERDGGGTIVN